MIKLFLTKNFLLKYVLKVVSKMITYKITIKKKNKLNNKIKKKRIHNPNNKIFKDFLKKFYNIIKNNNLVYHIEIFNKLYVNNNISTYKLVYSFLLYNLYLFVYENILFINEEDNIILLPNHSFHLIELLGLWEDETEFFINNLIYLIENNYTPIYNNISTKYIKELFETKKRNNYAKQFLRNKSKKIVKLYFQNNKNNVIGGSSKKVIKAKKENNITINDFNYYDNIHDFGDTICNSLKKYYNISSTNINNNIIKYFINKENTNIEKYFINKINNHSYIKTIDYESIYKIYKNIYDTITNNNNKFINDASGFSKINSLLKKFISKNNIKNDSKYYLLNDYMNQITVIIKQNKTYSINTFGNYIDAGKELHSSFNYKNLNKLIVNNKNKEKMNQYSHIINEYNKIFKNIFMDSNNSYYLQIELENNNIKLNIYKNNKIIENIPFYKGFNSTEHIKKIIKKYNMNDLLKIFYLRLKSLGDRIQAYELYLLNNNISNILLYKYDKKDFYISNKNYNYYLATSDQMLIYLINE